MNIDFLIKSRVESCNGLNYIMSNLPRCLLSKNLFILIQNLRVDTQTNITRQHLSPYLMIRACRRKRL